VAIAGVLVVGREAGACLLAAEPVMVVGVIAGVLGPVGPFPGEICTGDKYSYSVRNSSTITYVAVELLPYYYPTIPYVIVLLSP
jgi:hypothetical protein